MHLRTRTARCSRNASRAFGTSFICQSLPMYSLEALPRGECSSLTGPRPDLAPQGRRQRRRGNAPASSGCLFTENRKTPRYLGLCCISSSSFCYEEGSGQPLDLIRALSLRIRDHIARITHAVEAHPRQLILWRRERIPSGGDSLCRGSAGSSISHARAETCFAP